MHVPCISILFLLQPTNAQIYIYHNIFSLCNAQSYMFWYICIIFREIQNLYFAKLHKSLKLELLKLQFHKIIRIKYHLVITEWYSIVCATLQYLVKAVCLCGCIYTLYFVLGHSLETVACVLVWCVHARPAQMYQNM